MLRRITLQRFLIGALFIALAVGLVRILAVQGFMRPVRVVSGSMAERFLGEHFAVTCADCGFVFRFGVESPPPEEQAVCPNCGFARNAIRHAERKRGDRVVVDRGAYWFNPPQRFDLVAFRDPSQPLRWVVKRVAGLPGERVAIRHGDLYIDGKLWRKSTAEFRKLALLVHDNAFAPHRELSLPPRWRPDADPSEWKPDGAGFRFTPNSGMNHREATEEPEIDWLTYHHWRCFANHYPRSAEAPISDNCGYNQGESRELQDVVDFVVRCRTTLSGTRELALRIHDGREWFTVRLNLQKQSVTLLRGETQTATVRVSPEAVVEPQEIEFGLLDRQVVLTLGGREVLRQEYEPNMQIPFRPIAHPLAIGGVGAEISISHVRVFRDVYYLDPWSVGQLWEMGTAAKQGEYVVLGDNPPVSDDSRRWNQPALSARSILGRVIPWPW